MRYVHLLVSPTLANGEETCLLRYLLGRDQYRQPRRLRSRNLHTPCKGPLRFHSGYVCSWGWPLECCLFEVKKGLLDIDEREEVLEHESVV